MLAAPEVSIEPFWYLNFGAFDHVTLDVSNLSISTPYAGNDQLVVGNDKIINIARVGSFHFLSQTLVKCELVLDKILQVPNITKNLLSVAQLWKDNNVYFEFHATFFLSRTPR